MTCQEKLKDIVETVEQYLNYAPDAEITRKNIMAFCEKLKVVLTVEE